MEADKGKNKMTIDIGESWYEELKDVNFDISMLEDDNQQIQGDNRNNEVLHGNTATNAHDNGFTTASRRNFQRRPCPFVLKIYEMLADVQFNSLISWSRNGTSFIINDHHQFAAQLLPRFFRHNNISSFICQLNSYGFRKINWDKFEFQHEWFQKGKGQWLKNIKRKSAKKTQGQGEGQQEQQGINEMAALTMEKEMEEIREEQLEMKEQIVMLQQQLDILEKEMEEITRQARKDMSYKKAKMLMLLESFFECKAKQSDEMDDGGEERASGDRGGKGKRKVGEELKEKNERNKKIATDFESDSNLRKMLIDEMNMNNLAQEQPDNFMESDALAESSNFWTDYVEKLDHKPLISGLGTGVSQSQNAFL